LPFAAIKPGQTRDLPTRLVQLSQPDPNASTATPAKGEKLKIGEIGQISGDARSQKALKRLSEEKAPTNVAQLVMWRVFAGMEWNDIDRLSKAWANPHEMSLARRFVDRLDDLPKEGTGALLYQIDAPAGASVGASEALAAALKDATILGLKAISGIPDKPEGPAVACKIEIRGNDATVQVATSDSSANAWTTSGKFSLPLSKTKGEFNATSFADALAEGVLDRLVRAQLSPGPRAKGKPTYRIKIENASPLILNGLGVRGDAGAKSETPKVLSGISLSPFRSLTVPASEETVKELGLRKGVRVVTADLSGL
jgi:hypothetical protein